MISIDTTTKLYHCEVESAPPLRTSSPISVNMPDSWNWRRTSRDVTLLRTEIQNLKRDTVKKKDFRMIEKDLAKIVNITTTPSDDLVTKDIEDIEQTCTKDLKNAKVANNNNNVKNNVNKKKPVDVKNNSKNVNKLPPKHFKKQSFAVNMCLCSVTDPKNSALRDKLESIDRKNISKNKQTNELLQQVSNIKQTKPIADLPLQNKGTDIINNLKYMENDCKDDCVCFHKAPSNTSLDNLLRTLEKWNSDLEDTPNNFRKDEILRTHINNKSDNVIIKPQEKVRSYGFMKKSNNKIINYEMHLLPKHDTQLTPKKVSDFSSNSNKLLNLTKASLTDGDILLPTSITSEYMGAVNLDKSNENICKCNNKEKVNVVPSKCEESCQCPLHNILINKPRPPYENKMVQTKTNFTNEGSNDYNKDKVGDEMRSNDQNTNINDNQQSIAENKISQNTQSIIIPTETSNSKAQMSQNIIVGALQNELVSTNQITRSKGQNTVLSTGSTNSDIKTEEHKNQDCDYQIEFLGVTLTNAYFDENCHDYRTFSVPEKLSPDWSFGETNDKTSFKRDDELPTNTKNNTSDTNKQLQEFKDIIIDAFKKQKITNKDQELDTQSLMIKSFESCVCCQDESKDLEVNTFNLLEIYLKEKLGDIKVSCKSSCISREDENNLFPVLMEKIKQLILESTNAMKCKCADDDGNVSSSWNRAFNLLQEYVKTKIGRVQCMCDETTANDAILPEITDKVFALIQNDFKRLKDICKCKNKKKSTKQANLSVHKKNTPLESYPGENINLKQGNLTSSKDEKSVDKSVINIQTSQVFPIVDTKSCSVIDKDNKAIETEAIGDFLPTPMKDVTVCLSNMDMDNNNVLLKGNDFEPKHPNSLISKENVHTNEHNTEINKSSPYPYIGYTVNCSCDHNLGTCVCIKSDIQENCDKINNIWKTLTSSKQVYKDIGYIMDKTHKKRSLDALQKNYSDISENRNLDESDMKDDTFGFAWHSENIDNIHSIGAKGCSDNSIGKCSEQEFRHDDRLEWFDCGSQIGKVKTVHFPTLDKDETRLIKSTTCTSSSDISSMRTCPCSMVPVCHVKMLMENIGNKLANSECTCDTLNHNVCPVHSKKSIF